MNKFSIIIPAYNVSKSIETSIKSILNQSYKNFEIIIVDDCSTDNGKTLDIIEKFANSAKILKNKRNLGAGGARNTGLKEATGDYIIFLDSDDVLANENTLKELDNAIGNNTYDLIQLGFSVVGTREFTYIPTEESCEKSFQLAKNKYINVWSKCWNRNFILKNEIKFPENVIYEDVPFAFHGISKAEKYLIHPVVTHIYTSGRAGSNASKNQFKQGRDTVTCIQELTNLKDKINSEHIPFLIERINEQKTRLVVRIERVLNDNFGEIYDTKK